MSTTLLRSIVFLLYLGPSLLSLASSAQRIQGFVSLDCGSSASYTDPLTGLFWETDATFGLAAASLTASVDTPSSTTTKSYLVSSSQLTSIRYFPGNQTKYCYVFDDATHGIKVNATYLVRATFWARSTISGLPFTPKIPNGPLRFQLLLSADVWTNISIILPQTTPLQKEVYVVALSSSISVCLSGRGNTAVSALGDLFDTPFISSLEIRHIPIDEEKLVPLSLAMRPLSTSTRAVHTVYRLDYGSSTGIAIRYPDDTYDRIWQAQTSAPRLSTATAITDRTSNRPPAPVMQTAYTYNGSYFYINFTSSFLSGSRGGYAYSLYFAEISDNVSAAGQRVFDYAISTDTSNGALKFRNNIDLYRDVGKYTVFATYSLSPYVTLNDGGFIVFNFTRNETSIFGPLLSALELYNVSDHDAPYGSKDDEATAVAALRQAFPAVLATWSGDPCLPYPYDWIRCDSGDRPSIISLSLAHKGLAGEIPVALSNFTELQTLDLQGNLFSGSIPTFLGSLPKLTTLLLQDNNFSGNVPQSLLDKVNSGVLNISISGNPNLCSPLRDNSTNNSCQETTDTTDGLPIATIVGSIVGGIVGIMLVVIICYIHINRKFSKGKTARAQAVENEGESPSVVGLLDTNHIYHFTYTEIKKMSKSFSNKLGRGGFGDVFHGTMHNGTEVAIKVSSENSQGESRAFSNEVELLSRVHHKNLVKLIGYCDEMKLILVYEYLRNGSLESILQENQYGGTLFTWRDRLKIAIGSAEGLEYLHNHCTPPIIHRDIKTSNILLTESMDAKISDFGISRATRSASRNHIVTSLVGTRGYIPPDIRNNNEINEKVDVYAFGVVLLELITGRKPIFTDNSRQQIHIVDWVISKMQVGNLQTIVDRTLENNYNTSSVWNVIDVALKCVEPYSNERPKMDIVSRELKNASTMELHGTTTSEFSINYASMNVGTLNAR